MANDQPSSASGEPCEEGAEARLSTSAVLAALIVDAPADHVTLEWIVEHLRERSFGIVILMMALVGLIPGPSWFAGILLAIPAIQMILGRPGPDLPGFVASRRIPTPQLARLIGRITPALRRIERVGSLRWRAPYYAIRWPVGLFVLLLGPTSIAPVPFIHVLPFLAIMLLALALLEEDGILLCIGLLAVALSVVVTTAILWGTVEAGLLLQS
jgi:hypothetical protein